jgi:type IVB pilus formation R64 PilN family outer membrane protein
MRSLISRPVTGRLGSVLLCLAVSGCAIDQLSRQTRDYTRGQRQASHQTVSRFEQRVASASEIDRAQAHVGKPWVSGKAVPLAREFDLPLALRANVKTTLIFKHKATSLAQVASRIAQATQIPVRVSPEAQLPVGQFAPRLATTATVVPPAMTVVHRLPAGTQPLTRILDHVAATHQVDWVFDGKAIEFFRTRTRVFDIRALSVSAKAAMRLGKSSSQSNHGFDSAAQTELTLSDQSVVQDVAKQLEPFLTQAAVVAAQPGSLSSVVITDTPRALDAVEHYLDRLNRRLSRRIRLVFEQVTVTRDQRHEQGIDWQLAIASELGGLDVSGGSNLSTTPTLARINGPGVVPGLTAGLVLKAVSRYADVVRHTTVPVMTLNRRPVTHAVRSTFTYVDQVKSVSTTSSDKKNSNALPGIAVNQKRETVGAFLTLVPDVQDDGQVLLSVAFDNTVAMPLKTLTFGSAQNRMQVQQLDLRGNGTVQQVAVYPGRPTLVAGFEHQTNEVNQTRRAPHAPKVLGGGDEVNRQSTMTLIFVTVQVQEGG